MKKRVFRRWANDPELLCDLIVARLELAPDIVIDLVERGGVYVGGDRVTEPQREVAIGDKLTVHLSPATPAAPPIVVVYRDHDLAIVDKPAGIPSQAQTAQRSYCLEAMVTRDLGHAARPMHRLDKEASGLVVVALAPTAYAPLQQSMSVHGIERRYLAIVDGDLRGEGTLRTRIGRHARDQRLRAPFPEKSTTGESACTRYRVLAHGTLAGRPVTAVEAILETGRTHQIRVHLTSIEHPIVGDEAYGGPPYERMCLHAYALELPHPRGGRSIRASTPVPDSFARLVPGLTSPFT